tara:strand:- start:2326 stop:3969 length:1644 start_codon:yes stop_codon:yes gene_type:complete
MKPVFNILIICFISLQTIVTHSQSVSASIESDSILIGKKLNYTIDIDLEKVENIIFPDSISFVPFELISESKVDTLKQNSGFRLSKKYGIISFEDGEFIIPKLKIQIGDKQLMTDSKKITVNMVEVDTTKQGLYDIKPSYEKFSKFEILKLKLKENYLLIFVVISILISLLYFRSKIFSFFNPLLNIKPSLRPIELLKSRMIDLEKENVDSPDEIKLFYSKLTFSLRSFFEKEVYDKALESTTSQLIIRLNSIVGLKPFSISKKSINKLEEVFKRADLVKFAKLLPEKNIILNDLKVINEEIEIYSDLLPEPTEQEKLKNINYQKEVTKKLKKKRIKISLASITFLLIATFIFSGIFNGFQYTIDKITFNENLKLLEKTWLKSEYGSPGIFIETPEALIRLNDSIDFPYEDINLDSRFYYSNSDKSLELYISNYSSENKIDKNIYKNFLDFSLDPLITEKNILSLKSDEELEEFSTKNKQKGQIIYGPLKIEIEDDMIKKWGEYKFICFFAESEFKTVFLVHQDKRYLSEISERIIKSVEPNKEQTK